MTWRSILFAAALSGASLPYAADARLGRGRAEGSGWIMAVEGVVELPTGSEALLASGGGVDLGTQLLVTKNFEHACFHGSIGLVRAAE